MATKYVPLGSYNDAAAKAGGGKAAEMLDYYGKMWNQFASVNNRAGMDAAHAAAEAVRATLGYSGGADGSQYIPLDVPAFALPDPAYTPYSGTPSKSRAGAASASSYAPVSRYVPPSYEDYYANSGFDRIEEQLKSMYGAQTDQAVNALSAQKQSVTQDSDELARQAYIAYLQSKEALPQQLAAMGFNGGLSESRQVALESGWQEQRNQIGMQKNDALRSIDNAILQAASAGQTALASRLSELRAQSQNQYYDYTQKSGDAAREDYWKQAQYDYSRVNDELQALARQQEAAYQAERDRANDAFRYQQFRYGQTQDAQAADWQRLMFEYKQKQDELDNMIKRQQLLLQQQAARRR
ncbi:MAG: hypothetical protein LBR85_00180 [Oscillospiraceae bacterium]|jgi:hypothetical protein|nr:hypothetical protein [Oscillospiraceae bacterium]